MQTIFEPYVYMVSIWRQNVCIYGCQIVCPQNFSQKQNIGYKNMGHAKGTFKE